MNSKIYFAHPHTILDQVGKVLADVGPDNFFKSSDQTVKKAQEGFAAYFFTLALKQHTGRDWWLFHPDQAERSYPDFDFISFGEQIGDLKIESVELTGVYPHFKSFDEVLEVIQKKQQKYGVQPVKFSLLVYVNHEKSEEWINLLKERLISPNPFISIWTIHLRFKPGGKEVGVVVAQRIAPLPNLRVTADTDDQKVHQRQALPSYIEEKEENGIKYLTFKKDSVDKIIKELNSRKSNA